MLSKNIKGSVEAVEYSKQIAFPLESLLPISKPNESKYPALFTHIPLFEPIKDRSKAETKGWDPDKDADIYNADNIEIRRFGPGLTIYDEDTLIAILQLAAQKSLKGTRSAISKALNDISLSGDSEAVEEVYLGVVTAFKINEYLQRGTGGEQLRHCQESIDRLAVTVLMIYSEEFQKKGNTNFFRYVRDYSADGDVYIKIEPDMVRLLKDYTRVDLTVRRHLSDVGKSVHRFLSGQGNEYSVEIATLMSRLRYQGPLKEFNRALMGRKGEEGQLDMLVRCKWLESWEVTGTGRKSPFVLHTKRKLTANQD